MGRDAAFPKGAVRTLVGGLAGAVLLVTLPSAAFALDISNRYRSPRNPERAVRQSTELIVLHTTEAPARSSLNKLSERGEAHYCVTEEGTVYRIVDRDREAFHAGRSMWNGKEDVDKFSIGIECVGYHDKKMGLAQLTAIRDLVKRLQSMYRIPDERVVCHGHVAYGAPNKWHRKRHRGRKQCGMLFAMPSVRRVLNLKARPASDADVRAKRLIVGDPYLEKVLYGNVDTMRAEYSPAALAKTASAPKGVRPGFMDWFGVKQTANPPRSIADLKARGYVQKGQISREMTAAKIAGTRWNAADTYYTIRDKVIPGSSVDPAHLEKGMGVWLKK